MIRLRVPHWYTRMRTATKLQIAAAISVGFLIGYIFIPGSSDRSASKHKEGKDVAWALKDVETGRLRNGQIDIHVPAGKPAPVADVPTRVRDRGITFSGRDFVVNGHKTKLLSGAMHYFRIVPDYWEDRLQRLKSAGLNTVETYVAWNLHEPLPGKFDFTGILDIAEFIKIAKKLELNVIVRPGPYICSEWELGGLPGWLLHDPEMKLRTTYPPYLDAATRYFTTLMRILVPLQAAYDGPIIAFQIENEFTQYTSLLPDTAADYMQYLHDLMRQLGVLELLFTSDGPPNIEKALKMRPDPDVLVTINFQNEQGAIRKLQKLQPDKPVMVMEFWSGWFDHWGEKHLQRDISAAELAKSTFSMLQQGASINFYMFHGGTNFGFMNGGNWGDKTEYLPTITSYDYGAPLSECGDVTEKYRRLKQTLEKFAAESSSVHPADGKKDPPSIPPVPPDHEKEAYGEVKFTLYIQLLSTMQYIPEPYISEKPIPMELLPVNDGSGQSYGYVLYRTLIPSDSKMITVRELKDYGLAMLDFKPVQRLSSFVKHSFLTPKLETAGAGQAVLDILVENAGRVNYGAPLEVRKGINGSVEVDGVERKKWKIYSFEFKSSFVENIETGGMWMRTPAPGNVGPALYKGTFTIPGEPRDTFADMEGWSKGLLFINGANLGRYWNMGPQRTLYVPAPILKRGINKVMVFELHQPPSSQAITFRSSPVLDKTNSTTPSMR